MAEKKLRNINASLYPDNTSILKRTVYLIFIILILTGCKAQDYTKDPGNKYVPPPYKELIKQFEYDRQASLDIQEKSVKDTDGVKTHDISYVSPGGGRVPAYLIVPPGEGLFAGIIFLHAGRATRRQFIQEALELANRGVVSISIDAPRNRPDYNMEQSYSATAIQTVIDLRRAVDLLLERQDIDTKRLGFVGHSFGATWGGVFAGVENRIKAFVLMAGYGRPSWYDGSAIQLDGIYYIGHAAPAALLFQFATQDEYISREEAEVFYEAASEPKFIQWYDTDHFLNLQALLDRADWLTSQLKL